MWPAGHFPLYEYNSGIEKTVFRNRYNELGQLVEKDLHSTDDGASFLQSIDYTYNCPKPNSDHKNS